MTMIDNEHVQTFTKEKLSVNNITNYLKNYRQALLRTENASGAFFVMKTERQDQKNGNRMLDKEMLEDVERFCEIRRHCRLTFSS